MKTAIVVLSVLVASMNVFANEASNVARSPWQGCVDAALPIAREALAKVATEEGIYQDWEAVLKNDSEKYSFSQQDNSFSLSVIGYINMATYKIDVKLPLDGCDDKKNTEGVSGEVKEIKQGK